MEMTAQFLLSGHLQSSVWVRFYKDDVQHLEHYTSISRKEKAYDVLQFNISKTNRQRQKQKKKKKKKNNNNNNNSNNNFSNSKRKIFITTIYKFSAKVPFRSFCCCNVSNLTEYSGVYTVYAIAH